MKSCTISAAVAATAVLLVAPVRAFSGAGSFYNVETGNQVACGGFGKNTGWTVALNYAQWDGGSHCGQQITIRYEGKSQVATITDRCESCGGYGGIDLTPSLFSSFASQDRGIIQLTWDYGAGQPEPKPEPSTSSTPPPPPPSSTWTPPPPPPSTTWSPPPPPPLSSSSTSWSSSSTPSSSSSTSTWIPSSSSSDASSASSVNGTTSSASSALNSTTSLNSTATSTGTTFNNATSVITSDGATQSGSSGSGGSTSTLPGGSLAHINRLVIQMANMVRSASETASSA